LKYIVINGIEITNNHISGNFTHLNKPISDGFSNSSSEEEISYFEKCNHMEELVVSETSKEIAPLSNTLKMLNLNNMSDKKFIWARDTSASCQFAMMIVAVLIFKK
jgi:hypothetical protein